MFDDIQFDQLDIASIEHCTDPAQLRRALAILKARLARLAASHPDTTTQIKPLLQLIGFLGIAGADEPIGANDRQFNPDLRHDETPPGARTAAEIDAIFAALGDMTWPSIDTSSDHSDK